MASPSADKVADRKGLKYVVFFSKGNLELINEFTANLLEHGDYPKIVENEEDVQRRRLWRFHVENFNVKEFLYKVLDLKKVTEKYGVGNINLVKSYLTSRYQDVPEQDFMTVYDFNERNLLRTCEELDERHEPIDLALTNFFKEPFDEDFLLEIIYIDKRKEIEDYILEMDTKKKLEAEEAQLNDAFLPCPLCGDDEITGSEAVTCPDGHLFCKNCILRYIKVKMGDGVYKFCCPSNDCKMHFAYGTVEDLLPRSVFLKIIQKEQAEEINRAEIADLETCTFCDFAYIPDPRDKIFRCQNPDCLAEICRNCRELNHIPRRCEEIERPKDLEARKKIEESMTQKLIRVCPRCNKNFVKIDGCNKMTCTCGAVICYICRNIVNGYDHFKTTKCPLYSNNAALHERDVVAEGIRVRDEILREDPGIRIMQDPTKLDS